MTIDARLGVIIRQLAKKLIKKYLSRKIKTLPLQSDY